ncbi:hypothetical protein CYVG_00152 [Cyanophage S-SSM6a]|jgi:hypothetical protein|uniref:Uncharacterized protein n=1 Tax=Synechococcus phage S-SSM7 TaxID=445686 RepID=E3SLK2_9CAUD|nr:hypothetical protein SSSM7_289 [Synechococcus phage S-SSM7]ADO98350.1 hypothetical protein SSSM7_289 [Synechococcus phage S-SSM7]AGH07596.1 hypothetical protein CYVG_00152 [Cyanophage S-SSM6a]|tara:strand:- start:282 stop:446 length:165 start_codon:yes stop_codon:yes gene_type:complete
MIDVLLYMSLSCEDTADMIRRIREKDNVSALIQTELVDVLQEATPECSWDANAD